MLNDAFVHKSPHDVLVPAAQGARLVGVNLRTVLNWERLGYISARGVGRGRLFSLQAIRDAYMPAACLPIADVAARVRVSSSMLRHWEKEARIPAFVGAGPRKTFVREVDIPRLRAWYVWGLPTTPKWAIDYAPGFNMRPAVRDLRLFEAGIARGDIPERFSAAHYDVFGRRLDPLPGVEG